MTFAKKSYGQHFLKDKSVIEKIVAAADISADDITVEIGPGTGALTSSLPASRLILVEADQDLIPDLEKQFPEAKIIHADAATVDYGEILKGSTQRSTPTSWMLVGNLPYNAGNAIIMHALQAKNPPKRLVVMLQKEVGERMLGAKGAESVLTVAIQLYAHAERVCTVKPGAFNPPPKVDSIVLKLTPYESSFEKEKIIAVAKVGFGNRRKQLHKNLSEAKMLSREEAKSVLKSLGLSELARAEELSLEQWVKLAQMVNIP